MFIVEGKGYKMEKKLRFWEGVIFKDHQALFFTQCSRLEVAIGRDLG